MALSVGTCVGPYEILSALGAGGMGEVYRARDTKLNRRVAIKVLPDLFASDTERLARFTREAQTLGALNHPHIAQIYGLEQSDGVRALIMELVEGEDLSERIARGAIPLDEALPIAKQIAEALGAAHEQGIIHRDLKPANIKVRSDGTVKVLDFGLAKALDPTAVTSANVPLSPTITTPAMTQAGMILGTAAYMSPEQARGTAVDKRADVWAFGVVLWEMITGTRLFEGSTVSDTLASVLKTEPDWNALPQTTPPAIRRLLRRCLEKDRQRRLDSAAAARLEIDEALMVPSASTNAAGERTSVPRLTSLPWIVASAAVLAAAALAIPAVRYLRHPSPVAEAVRFDILPAPNTQFGGPEAGGTGTAAQLAVSPDGRAIVFVATSVSGYQLWLRPIGAVTPRPIAGTENGIFPFWSPDSRTIGFFADGKLKKVQVSGGPPVTLCDAPAGRGGSWNGDNVIVFAPAAGRGIERVSSGGGIPVPVSALDATYGETAHRWPHFLPDGRHFLYTAVVGTCCPASKPARVKIAAFDRPETTSVMDVESPAAYASGYLLFNRGGTLMAQPFDATSRQLTGDAVIVAEDIGWEGSRYASFSASDTGVLLYAAGLERADRRLTWLDREGKAIGSVGERNTYANPALSGDERNVAVQVTAASSDIWILNADGKQKRLTFDAGGSSSPIWSPDGLYIAFAGTRKGAATLRQRLVSLAGDEEELVNNQGSVSPTGWSADGRFLVYNRTIGTEGSSDIWVLPLAGDRKPFPFAQTAANESTASFAPDGKWIAYQSVDQNARSDVYVRPFPPSSGQVQISTNGGQFPKWRADGHELFFIGPEGTMMAVDVDTTRQIDVGVPRPLFKRAALQSVRGRPYAVSKDGKRFLVNLPPEQSAPTPLTVLVNWTATIQK